MALPYYGCTYQVRWRDQLRLPSTALVAAASALAPLHVNEQAIDGKFIVVFKKTS